MRPRANTRREGHEHGLPRVFRGYQAATGAEPGGRRKRVSGVSQREAVMPRQSGESARLSVGHRRPCRVRAAPRSAVSGGGPEWSSRSVGTQSVGLLSGPGDAYARRRHGRRCRCRRRGRAGVWRSGYAARSGLSVRSDDGHVTNGVWGIMRVAPRSRRPSCITASSVRPQSEMRALSCELDLACSPAAD